MAENRNTVAAPGVGECEICTEEVCSVKLLPCHHSLCQLCLNKLSEFVEASKLACPLCRKRFSVRERIRTRYFGKVSCDNCIQMKDASDSWWCTDCKKVLCSYCMVKEHKYPDHKFDEWNRLVQVDICQAFLSDTGTKITADSKKKNVEKMKALFEPIFHDVAEKIVVENAKTLQEEEHLNEVFGPCTNTPGNYDNDIGFEDLFKLSSRFEQLTGYPSKVKSQEFGSEVDMEKTALDHQFFTSSILKQLKLHVPELHATACAAAGQAPQPYLDYNLKHRPESQYWRLVVKAPNYVSLVTQSKFETFLLGESKHIIGSFDELAAQSNYSYVLDLVLCSSKQRIYVLRVCTENNILSNIIHECSFKCSDVAEASGVISAGSGCDVLAKFQIPGDGSYDGFIACTETGVVYFTTNTTYGGTCCVYLLKLVMLDSTGSIKGAQCKKLYSEIGSRFCAIQARYDSRNLHMVIIFEDQKKNVRIFRYRNIVNYATQHLQVHISTPIRNLFYGHDGKVVIAFGNELWITTAVIGETASTIEKYKIPSSRPALSKSKFIHHQGRILAVDVVYNEIEQRIVVYKVKIDKSSSTVELE